MPEANINPIQSEAPPPITAKNVDLSNCDREQIHLVNAIQPHGVLLVLNESTLSIIQVSANTESFLGLSSEAMIGQTIDCLLDNENVAALRSQLATKNLADGFAHLLTVSCVHTNERFHLFGNRIDDLLLLEFERPNDTERFSDTNQFLRLNNTIQQLRGSTSLLQFIGVVVNQIRDWTGFERVMAYRFDTDGCGEVVAESKSPELEAYLGLHYPASDIPAPARRLFMLSPLRHLPNVDYLPVPLIPENPPLLNGRTVDLSYSFLRSVSVMYSGYLRNMGAKATMVLPLIKDGELWGLISCLHHSTPKYMPYESRIPVEFLAQIMSQMMNDREKMDYYGYRSQLDQTLHQLAAALERTKTFEQALVSGKVNLLTTIDAQGVALIINGKLTLLGKTPTEQQIGLLVVWLAQQDGLIFSTRRLPHDFPLAQTFKVIASGVLSIRFSLANSDGIIWFRPEAQQEVSWAGNPNKPVEVIEEGQEIRLFPRTSFALWKEYSSGQSRFWLTCELEYAKQLRQVISDIMVNRTSLLTQINAELERSNAELEAFAYVASHDLKEPLRGIHNFAELIKLENNVHSPEKRLRRIETILSLTNRMDSLLESLLKYSRIGLSELDLQSTHIGNLVSQSIDVLKQANPEMGVTFTIQPTLPVIDCDRMRVEIIFHNLILNAIKYNDKAEKTVEIGCNTSVNPVEFYVRDNGIGIPTHYQEHVFQLFRRLHGSDEFGGGNGTGLTTAQKAIKRHGGRIWMESSENVGTTFYFTLAPDLISKKEMIR